MPSQKRRPKGQCAIPTSKYRLNLVREGTSSRGSPSCATPVAAAVLAHQILAGFDREAMGVLFLDTRNRAIGYTIAYVGTLDRALAEPRGLLVPALLANAAGIIIFHNHPSGDPDPSGEDLLFTRRMTAAAELLGIRCHDHLILGEPPTFISLREHGW
jgi:DNA repair protein RadC